jgi:hypothetical protein
MCHVLSGELELAVAELNEALQIARRGPMPLFHADILLTRARLFGRRKDEGERLKDDATPVRPVEYLWPTTPQADLAEARRLIEHHGYLRRLPELEDAEALWKAESGRMNLDNPSSLLKLHTFGQQQMSLNPKSYEVSEPELLRLGFSFYARCRLVRQ